MSIDWDEKRLLQDKLNERSKRLRRVAFTAVVCNTVAVSIVLFSFPVLIGLVQRLNGDVQDEVEYCKATAATVMNTFVETSGRPLNRRFAREAYYPEEPEYYYENANPGFSLRQMLRYIQAVRQDRYSDSPEPSHFGSDSPNSTWNAAYPSDIHLRLKNRQKNIRRQQAYGRRFGSPTGQNLYGRSQGNYEAQGYTSTDYRSTPSYGQNRNGYNTRSSSNYGDDYQNQNSYYSQTTTQAYGSQYGSNYDQQGEQNSYYSQTTTPAYQNQYGSNYDQQGEQNSYYSQTTTQGYESQYVSNYDQQDRYDTQTTTSNYQQTSYDRNQDRYQQGQASNAYNRRDTQSPGGGFIVNNGQQIQQPNRGFVTTQQYPIPTPDAYYRVSTSTQYVTRAAPTAYSSGQGGDSYGRRGPSQYQTTRSTPIGYSNQGQQTNGYQIGGPYDQGQGYGYRTSPPIIGPPPVVYTSSECCTCNQGLPGPAGLPGASGANGANGINGNPGNSGSPAPAVQRSVIFPPQCPCEAPTGQRGEQGPKGPPGIPGSLGSPGSDALPGPEGDPGPQGSPGPNGGSGTSGGRGQPGPMDTVQGDSGPAGPRGTPGQPGRTGEMGEMGEPGGPGGDGSTGEPGSRGQDGRDGYRGKPGYPGGMGMPGDCSQCEIPRLAPGY